MKTYMRTLLTCISLGLMWAAAADMDEASIHKNLREGTPHWQQQHSVGRANVPIDVIQGRASPALFRGHVWLDDNGDGVNNIVLKEGVEGVAVSLWRQLDNDNDKYVKSRMTGENGFFQISLKQVKLSSKYYLKFKFRSMDQGYYVFVSNGTVDQDGRSSSQLISQGKTYEINASVRPRGAIFYGQTWFDENSNGIMDKIEEGTKGKVSLWAVRRGASPKRIKTRAIATDGTFQVLLQKVYKTRRYFLEMRLKTTPFSMASGKRYRMNAAIIKPEPDVLLTAAGKSAATRVQIDAAATLFHGHISWIDDNIVRDGFDQGVPAVVVELWRTTQGGSSKPKYIKQRTTRSDGSFEIPLQTVHSDSKYYLKFELNKQYYEFASKGNHTIISNGYSTPQSISEGMSYEINVGIRPRGAVLDGQTWLEGNANGIMDGNEQGATGKVVLWQVQKGASPKRVKTRKIHKDGSFRLPLKTVHEDREYFLEFRLKTSSFSAVPGKRYKNNAAIIKPRPPSPPAVITGWLWDDLDADSMIDSGDEDSFDTGYTVSLWRTTSASSDELIEQQHVEGKSTDPAEFRVNVIIEESKYYLLFQPDDDGYKFSPKVEGGDSQVDQDGRSNPTSISYGHSYEISAGAYKDETSSTLRCHVSILHITADNDTGNRTEFSSNICGLVTEELEPESEYSYYIDLSPDFINENIDALYNGEWYIKIVGAKVGHESHPEFGQIPRIMIDEDATLTTLEPPSSDRRGLTDRRTQSRPQWKRRVLAVRLAGTDGPPGYSAIEIHNRLFGTGVTLKSQYEDCSSDRLMIIAARANAALDLALPLVLLHADVNHVVNEVIKIHGSTIRSFDPDHIMLFTRGRLSSKGSVFGGSCAWQPGQRLGEYSVFTGSKYLSSVYTVHEIGHNLGLKHAGQGSDNYGDWTGNMGEPKTNKPKLCFNGRNDWFLESHGFYKEDSSKNAYHTHIAPEHPSSLLTLAAFMDYEDTASDQYVVIKVVDESGTSAFYLHYNRAKGCNEETQEYADKVTIVEERTEWKESTKLVAGLDEEDNRRFTRGDLWIEVCSFNTGVPESATISISMGDSKCRNALLVFGANGALYSSDGSSLGATIIKDGIQPLEFETYHHRLYFSAFDEEHGSELWVSDASEESTEMVKDIVPGRGSANPSHLTVYNGGLYFLVEKENEFERELWVSRGTAASTEKVVGGFFDRVDSFIEYKGNLYFAGYKSASGTELYMTNGTADGTVLLSDINAGSGDSNPMDFTVYSDKLFFTAFSTNDERELFVTDGTQAGTKMVKDIYPGGSGSFPRFLTVLKDKLYLVATGLSGPELWTSDGSDSGTRMVKAIPQVPFGNSPYELTVFKDQIFFGAGTEPSGDELWATDGTGVNTKVVKRIYVDPPGVVPGGSPGSKPHGFTVVGSRLFFSATDYSHGTELFATDGSKTGTILVKDIHDVPSYPGSAWTGSSYPFFLTACDSLLYFRAFTAGHGFELWSSDGSADGTRRVGPVESDPSHLYCFDTR